MATPPNFYSSLRTQSEESEIAKIQKDIIESFLPLLSPPDVSQLDQFQIKQYRDELPVWFSIYALWAALFFKHNAYKHESEVRFLQLFGRDISVPDVKWRHRSYELVKYREFNWRCDGVLKQIVVGPAAEKHKANRFVRDCLNAFHVDDVEIKHSQIPYRAVTTK